ncbi:SAF domain-containing protein [Cellulomonas sp. RIT-PI-Y]|uniref:SAF domain-containing protein n=1 Tax=Cellulomonas sp. RIT-PI-Y TaxID=3035297 RepID=UPI0021D94A65|nr:SAF domain-containing protein [Cellulomonas sp. RIT-PI-Y]
MPRPPHDGDRRNDPHGSLLRSPRARLLLWRLRRPTAAVLTAVAAVLTVQAVRSPGPPNTPVLVAARDLPAGTTLAAEDLDLRALPTAALPAGSSADRTALTGARTAVALPTGLPVVPSLLTDTLATGPPGTVVVPVRFADDATAALLAPGRRIDVVSAPLGAAPTTVATGALVLTAADPGSDGGLLGGTGDGAGPLLLAVDPAEAVQLSAASASSGLSAILVE